MLLLYSVLRAGFRFSSTPFYSLLWSISRQADTWTLLDVLESVV